MRFSLLFSALPTLAILHLTACGNGGSSGDQGDPPMDAGTPPEGMDSSFASDAAKEAAPPSADAGAAETGTDAAPPQTTSQCKVTRKGTAGVVFKGTLLLPDSVIQGEVFVNTGGIIACAAADCSATDGYAAASLVGCDDTTISPGLINPHDHISFADVPPKPTTERYEHRHDWRKGLRGHTEIKITPIPNVPQAVRAAELRFLMGGATSSVSSGGEDGLIRNLDNATELEGVRAQAAFFDTFPLGDSNGTLLASGCAYPSRTTTASIAHYDGYFPHISEGVDNEAHNEMVCQDALVAPDATYDLVQRQSAIIHGIAVTAADVAEFRTQRSVLVWSPRSNVSLYGNTAPIVLYDNLGVELALGTDWLPSGSMNMQRELQCADALNQNYFGQHFTDKQLWTMVTANAASAAGVGQVTGALLPGYWADIAIFNSTTHKQYRAVIDANPEDILYVARAGASLYGDATLLDDLDGKACEPLPVCGLSKKACVKQDTGTTLADVMADAAKVYPLFFCKGTAVTDEPSCAPVRANYLSGSMGSIYAGIVAGDKDGDGVPDATDLCPSIFNPIRPMDPGVQADSDGDGIGDACDKCPFDAGETCVQPSSNDADGDGITNAADNCPRDANPDQADADMDGKGDVCDKCPNDPNPGASFCTVTVTIADLRNPALPTHPIAGTVRAKITGAEVTAIKSVGSGDIGFFVQQVGATTFGGLFVSTVTVPTVAVGNVVDVVGDYNEVFGLTYLATPTVTVTDPKTTLTVTPQLVPTATLASKTAGEPYECMLIETGAVTVTNMNPDAPKNYDEFEVTGSLRVGNQIYNALNNTYPVGTAFTQMIAIAGFTFSERKIWPRGAADVSQ